MTLLNKDDDSKVKSCCVTSDARHPRVCLRKMIIIIIIIIIILIIIIIIIKTYNYKWPVRLLCPFWRGFGLSGLVMAFQACVWPGYGLSGLCLALLTL